MAQYRTLREIACRMRWSPSTVLRRHKLDEFPLYLDWTARGLIWVTSDALIDEWERRKVQMNQGARLKRPWKWRHKPTYQPYNWRLRYKNETHSETRKESAGQSEDKTEQTPYARHAHKCPTVSKEPSKLGPTNPAQREELSVKVPKKCTCGTPEPCTAHD